MSLGGKHVDLFLVFPVVGKVYLHGNKYVINFGLYPVWGGGRVWGIV